MTTRICASRMTVFAAIALGCSTIHASVAVDPGHAVPALKKYVLLQPASLSSEGQLAMRVLERSPFKIVLVGDSTVATEGGWGPGFCATLRPNVTCVDLAENGRSTKSYIDEGLWRKALAEKGNYYFIQFGHNDQKPDPTHHADADGLYSENLRRFIHDVRSIDGIPIILSPLSRRNYADHKLTEDGLKQYGAAASRVAAEEKVTFVDLLALSQKYLGTKTQQEADTLNATTHPDAAAENASAAKPDRTHLNDTGKTLFGRMVADNVIRIQVELGPNVKSPTPQQHFSAQSPFDSGDFTRPGASLTPAQITRRNDAWRAEIRKQLFIPDRLPALRTKHWSTFSPMKGVLADRITYSTANGMRVPVIVYRPDPKVVHWSGKLPGIVIVNGHGGDKFSWYAFYSGMLFARAGAVAVTYDPLGEGERNSTRTSSAFPSEHDKQVDLPHWGQRLAGLMQVDVMQAVSYLRSQPEVDPNRIGTVGYSMGAFITGITGAIDTRIHAVLLSGGGTYDGPNQYFDNNKLPCQTPPYLALGVLGDRGAILYALNADRGPIYVMNGDADTVMKMANHPPSWFNDVRTRAINLAGGDHNMFTTILYPGISHRTSWVNLDGMVWLNQQLHFGLWDESAIRAAGTTHISTWIAANNVDISRNYIPEDREGGLDAVGMGFPGIPRANLMVLRDEEWQKQKDMLIYDAWATKIRLLEQH